jgi:hypothetical protein
MTDNRKAALAIIGDIFSQVSEMAILAHTMDTETLKPPPKETNPPLPATSNAAQTPEESTVSATAPAAPPATAERPQPASQSDVLAMLRRKPGKPE